MKNLSASPNPLMPNRRGVLAAMGAWLAQIPLSASAAPNLEFLEHPPARGQRFLTQAEVEVVAQFCRIAFPSGGAFETGWEEADLLSRVDQLWFGWSPLHQKAVHWSLWGLRWGVPWVLLRFSRFEGLDARGAAEYLTRLSEASLGIRYGIFRILRLSLAFCFYNRPETAQQIGYTPKCGPMTPFVDPLIESSLPSQPEKMP